MGVFIIFGSDHPDKLSEAVKELCEREEDIESFFLVDGTWFLSTQLLVRELNNLLLYGEKDPDLTAEVTAPCNFILLEYPPNTKGYHSVDAWEWVKSRLKRDFVQ